MNQYLRWALLGLATVGCSRANLDVIWRSATDGGADSITAADSRSMDSVSDVPSPSDAAPDTAPDTAPACPTSALKPGDITQTVRLGTANRSYVLHVPSAYDGRKPAPLILDFHAIGGSASLERTMSPYPAVTDAEGVIMAFPAGLAGPSGPAWNIGPCCVSGTDDVAFVKAVVNQISASACIDASRVYAVGTSMGGGMAYYLGCHAAEVFAALATSAFDLMQEEIADCKPARPLTVISFRSTGDQLVPYAGGPSSVVPNMPVTFLGAQGTFQEWATLDGCSGLPSQADSNGCSTYNSCQSGVEVTLCTKLGGSQDAANATLSWPVLKRFRLP